MFNSEDKRKLYNLDRLYDNMQKDISSRYRDCYDKMKRLENQLSDRKCCCIICNELCDYYRINASGLDTTDEEDVELRKHLNYREGQMYLSECILTYELPLCDGCMVDLHAKYGLTHIVKSIANKIKARLEAI